MKGFVQRKLAQAQSLVLCLTLTLCIALSWKRVYWILTMAHDGKEDYKLRTQSESFGMCYVASHQLITSALNAPNAKSFCSS